MQLVRPHQILRLLGDHTVHRRKQLRAHGRIQHIPKHFRKLPVLTGIRIIFYQMPHQRLRHSGVDTVHGHVISIIGSPA